MLLELAACAANAPGCSYRVGVSAGLEDEMTSAPPPEAAGMTPQAVALLSKQSSRPAIMQVRVRYAQGGNAPLNVGMLLEVGGPPPSRHLSYFLPILL